MVMDAKGDVSLFNLAAERIFQMSRDDLIGRKADEMTGFYNLTGTSWPALAEMWSGQDLADLEAVAREAAYEERFEVDDRAVSMRVAPVIRQGMFEGIVAVFRDITGIQYGPLQDDIIYDPDAPEINSVTVLEPPAQSTLSALADGIVVRVTASDINGGLDEIQLSSNSDMDPYTAHAATGGVTEVAWDSQDSDTLAGRSVDQRFNARIKAWDVPSTRQNSNGPFSFCLFFHEEGLLNSA